MAKALNIKIFGVGGGGCNAVDYMLDEKIDILEYVQINTDAQSLKLNKADKKIHIGKELTKGLGAGAIPEIGSKSLVETKDEIISELEGQNMIFIASGMGGGTGTGAAPELASLAKERGILTISVVTKPFTFEGQRRLDIAEQGIEKLRQASDLVVIIPNQRLVENHRDKILEDAFQEADSVLKDGVRGVIDLLGIINNEETIRQVDFKTLEDALRNSGLGVLGVGEITDSSMETEEIFFKALDKAIKSDMLDISIHGAQRIFLHITTSITEGVTHTLISKIISDVQDYAGSTYPPELSITEDKKMPKSTVGISIIATGYPKDRQDIIQATKPIEKQMKANQTQNLEIDIPIF